MVDFPAPFSPSRAWISPTLDFETDIIEGANAAEMLWRRRSARTATFGADAARRRMGIRRVCVLGGAQVEVRPARQPRRRRGRPLRGRKGAPFYFMLFTILAVGGWW